MLPLLGYPSPRAVVSVSEEEILKLKRVGGGENAFTSGRAFTEEELMAVYEDLLASPVEAKPDDQAQQDETATALQTVEAALKRLPQDEVTKDPEPSLQRTLIAHLETILQQQPEATSQNTPLPHHALITRLEAILPQQPGPTTQNIEQSEPVVAENEWEALVQVAVEHNDIASAHQVLSLIERFGSTPSERCLNPIMNFYASRGDVSSVENMLKHYVGTAVPTIDQRDIHVKAHLRGLAQSTFPTDALDVLHAYEARGIPAPQKTYKRAITHLTYTRSAVAYAHAWDLFAHMRYVAHPMPDERMYTLMIRTCALPSLNASGEPERALDLFTEMTVDNQIQPTLATYNAVILACARSGRKKYVLEAFRLAKVMLDSHRDARGKPAFTPDRRFFASLLDGAKRIGDLARVRWILAEMVKGALQMGDQGAVTAEHAIIQEDVMAHVFHAYAAYRVPFKPWMTVIVDEKQAQRGDQTSSGAGKEFVDSSPASQESVDTEALVPEENVGFAHIPPQTDSEVIQEVEVLFSRIFADRVAEERGEDVSQAVFRHVRVSSKLLDAYLTAYYSHSSLEEWRNQFKHLHARLNVPRSSWTYEHILQRCAKATKGIERVMARKLAEEVWDEWVPLEAAWRQGAEKDIPAGMTARRVEQVNAAMIRILALNHELPRAMQHVRSFARAYPPPALHLSSPAPRASLESALFSTSPIVFNPDKPAADKPAAVKHVHLSTRTSLVGSRPLVRLINSTEIPDETVPPLLTFSELEVLHHRLVSAKRAEDIRYIKWLSRAYEGALKARRDSIMSAKPVVEKNAAKEDDMESDQSDGLDSPIEDVV
ncbi:hypothetical protein BDW22DRAFT_1347966 [Trametopsis cervina]|nr:hypothetical protein BDW22DRAFT_1347966 [Trametopsis cervina]